MNRVTYFLIMLAGTAFFAVGTYFIFSLWQDRMRLGTESEHWPTSPATVTGSFVTFQDGAGSQADRTPYQPRITYTYDVNGVEMSGNLIAATHPAFSSREETQAWIDAYPKEGLVAHYNPENGAEAVLEPGVPLSWRLLVLFPVLCGVVTLFLFASGVRALIKGVPQGTPPADGVDS